VPIERRRIALMSSVSVSWTGACTSATEQGELLSYVGRLAEVNDILLNGKLPPRRHPFLELITAKRAEGLKPRPNVEVVEQQIAGKIVSMPTSLPMLANSRMACCP
jgi:hypothetical protein